MLRELIDVLTALVFYDFLRSFMLTGCDGCIESDSKSLSRWRREALEWANDKKKLKEKSIRNLSLEAVILKTFSEISIHRAREKKDLNNALFALNT